MQKDNLPYRTIFLEEFAKSSWEYLQHIGYPNSNDEEWRFSNPNPWILSNKFNKIKKNNFPIEHDVNESIDNYLTIKICDNNISIPKRLPDGIEIFDMFQGMEKNILDGAIGSVSDYHNTAFSAENMALFNNGILIYVHVLMDGKIVKTGNESLAKKLEKNGYSWIEEELKISI